MASEPAPVRVSVHGELRGEIKIPGKRAAPLLRVLVDGQYVGEMEWDGQLWHAAHQANVRAKARETTHTTADEALAAVLRSGFARKLGARATSPVHWTDRARRLAARKHTNEGETNG